MTVATSHAILDVVVAALRSGEALKAQGISGASGRGPDAERAARKRLSEMLQGEHPIAVEGLTAGSGQEFLTWLARYLQASVGMQFAFVGERAGDAWDRIRTMCVCRAGAEVENFEYDLRGTPCANVLRQSLCVHADRVAELYPEDRLLAEMGIESYVGVSLFGTNEAPLGLMVLLDSHPISDEKVALAVATLDLFRGRAEAELNYRAALDAMELEVGDTAEETINALTRSFARTMNVRCAFVSEPDGEDPERLRTISSHLDGAPRSETTYPRANSPCAEVYERGTVLIPRNARTRWFGELWPKSDFLAGLDVEAYAGALIRDTDGRPLGHIALAHDGPLSETLLEDQLFRLFRSRITTELKRRETENRRAEIDRVLRETQRRQSLGVLAGGIAHDFNNLLVSITGHADVLLQGKPEESTREGLETILSASKQAAQLCEHLLAYAGKGTSAPELLDFNEIFSDVERLTSFFVAPQCKFITQLNPTPVVVRADAVQLQQIAMNLTKNAADAIGQRPGLIALETGIEHCNAERLASAYVGRHLPEGEYAFLGVSDNGPGMEPNVLKRIFDPFFSTKQTGHGLGLAAVLGIVESQGGALTVESQRGWGTRFRVYLPLAKGTPAPRRSRSSARPEPISVASGSILQIDDEPMVLKATKAILKQLGLASITAGSGREGIELYRTHHESIRCIILDLSMPEMGGAQVLAVLREINPNARILIASGYPEMEAFAKLREKPNGMIMKPFGVADLEAKLVSIGAI